MNKLLVIMFVLLIGCTSTNKKLETHPTNNLNALEKFWDTLGSGKFDKLTSTFKTTY
jgi:hypothetical protein